jgi:ABC-type multidrug transport system ATPase subunit
MARVTVGSGPSCDVVLAGAGVSEIHLEVSWAGGFVVHNCGTGRTRLNGAVVPPGATFRIENFRDRFECGDVPLSLGHPALRPLYLRPRSRSPSVAVGPGADGVALLAADADLSAPYLVGSDATASDLVVDHPAVQRVHVRILPGGNPALPSGSAAVFEDTSGGAGVFTPAGERLAPGAWHRMDEYPGVYLGNVVWVPFDAFPFGRRRGASAAKVGRPPQRPAGTVLVEPKSFVPGKPVIVGRTPEADICLPYPQVSARHCRLEAGDDGTIRVTDLGSLNGTTVRGARLRPNQPETLSPGERILVGPFPLRLATPRAGVVALDGGEKDAALVEVEAEGVCFDLPARRGRAPMRLLDRVSFKAMPGDCIAIMGPSGAGKTTLLNVVAGAHTPTEGHLRVNGEDLAALFDALRGYVGYVPQDDILHPELRVEEAVRFSARLRLPPDFTDAEIEERVTATLRDLRLEHKRHDVIGRPESKVLSGGERKRVNIAIELVTEPRLLLLDEPTSGLAADDTAAFVEMMTALAKSSNMTVLMTIHQPAKEDFERFSRVLVLGCGGKLAYFGTPTGSYDFFGAYLENRGQAVGGAGPRDIFTAMTLRERDVLALGTPEGEVRRKAADGWQDDFAVLRGGATVASNGVEPARGPAARAPRPRRVSSPRQLGQLIRRYALVKIRDTTGLRILLLQAPVIALLMTLVFLPQPAGEGGASRGNDALPCLQLMESLETPVVTALVTAGVPTERAKHPELDPAVVAAVDKLDPKGALMPGRIAGLKLSDHKPHLDARFKDRVNDQSRALFLLVIAAIWLGTSNAAREIVDEQAVYQRERRVNLGIANYVVSKLVVLGALCGLQCFVLAAIPWFGLCLSTPFISLYAVLLLAAVSSVAIGLLLSTVVRSTVAALALTPVILIPQVVLGGGVVELTRSDWIPYAAGVMPARWAYELAIYSERSHVDTSAAQPGTTARASTAARANWPETPLLRVHDETVEFQNDFSCAKEHVLSTAHGGMGFSTADRPWVATGMLSLTLLGSLGVVAALLKRRDRR